MTDNERLMAVETEVKWIKQGLEEINNNFKILFEKINDMTKQVSETVTTSYKLDLKTVKEEIEKELTEIKETITNNKTEVKNQFKKFEVLRIALEYPKLTLATIAGLISISFSDIREWIVNLITK